MQEFVLLWDVRDEAAPASQRPEGPVMDLLLRADYAIPLDTLDAINRTYWRFFHNTKYPGGPRFDEPISASLVSPRARHRVFCLPRGDAGVYEADSGVQLAMLSAGNSPVNEVDWSRSGKLIAFGASDGAAYLWRFDTVMQRVEVWNPAAGKVRPEYLPSMPDPSKFNWESARKIRNYSVPEAYRDALMGIPDATTLLMSAAFSPNNNQFAIGCFNGNIAVWDADTGERIREFTGHEFAILGLDYIDDGQKLLAVDDQGNASTWDVESGERLANGRPLTETEEKILSFPRDASPGEEPMQPQCVSPDKRRIFTVSRERHLTVQDAQDHHVYLTVPIPSGAVAALGFLPDSRLALAYRDFSVYIFNVDFYTK
jgi:WD40 repeat protein